MDTSVRLDGERLRRARLRVGISQAELARRIGLSNSATVSQWERGAASPGSPHLLRALGEAVRTKPARLLQRPPGGPGLRWLRYAGGLGVPELAAAIGVAASTVSRWEHEGLADPEPATIAAVAQALDASETDVRRALRRFSRPTLGLGPLARGVGLPPERPARPDRSRW